MPVPPPNAQAKAPVGGTLFLPQGLTPTVIDLSSDNTPADKGKQKVDVEMVDGAD
jgi:hypothetical protein